jgi:hypothetical protein
MAETKKSTPKKKTSSTSSKTTTKKTTSKKTTTKAPTKSTTKKEPVVKKETTVKEVKPKKSRSTVSKKQIEDVLEGKKERKRLGKTFYLVFSIVFFTIAFFYINNVIYDNSEPIQSALFAFAALFIVFILLNFNVHGIIINFFTLPFKYLFTEASYEIRKDVEVIGSNKRGKFSKYKAIFTLTLYVIIVLLLIGSQIYNGIIEETKVLVILTKSLTTAFGFLVIVCSWQYLFNIIPSILDKTIDAKNGFILTLSAIVMIVYVVFIIFDISYLAEVMIFLLIIGFVSLLGVNLNMIVGEFNIFGNLRKGRHSKAVSRAVFLIFFSFHLYVILYASVVAYSIYNANPDTYNFTNFEYKEVIVDDATYLGNVITEVYDGTGTLINTVYDSEGNEITDFKNSDGTYIKEVYDSSGNIILDFYASPTDINPIQELEKDGLYYYPVGSTWGDQFFIYYEGGLVGVDEEVLPHSYGDMLYYTVITISSVGYGDISPNTNYPMPQFWGGFLSIYGLTFYALSIGYVSNIAIIGVTEKREED